MPLWGWIVLVLGLPICLGMAILIAFMISEFGAWNGYRD